MTNEEFLRDVCPNHTEKSQWNKSELLHILELQKEQLRLHIVSQQRELFNAILDFSEDLPMCTEDYHRSELWEKYKALNCG